MQLLHALQGDRAGDVLQPARGDQRGDGGHPRIPGGNQGQKNEPAEWMLQRSLAASCNRLQSQSAVFGFIRTF